MLQMCIDAGLEDRAGKRLTDQLAVMVHST
jgi:hypothetical protein